jgi:DNA polymerase-4
VLLPPDFERYTAVSREIMAVFRGYTPLVEPLSLDEAFLDVQGCERLFGDGEAIGRAIKADILKRTGLVASVGVAPSKFLAKLASDLGKPDGFRVIRPEEVRSVLDPLPVSKIYGVGPRTARRLEFLGVKTVGDLAQRDRDEVVREFGASGLWIHDLAHGIDSRRVTPRREEKSHGMERTFPKDVVDREELRLFLLSFCEEVAYGLRDRGLRGRTVTLKASRRALCACSACRSRASSTCAPPCRRSSSTARSPTPPTGIQGSRRAAGSSGRPQGSIGCARSSAEPWSCPGAWSAAGACAGATGPRAPCAPN